MEIDNNFKSPAPSLQVDAAQALSLYIRRALQSRIVFVAIKRLRYSTGYKLVLLIRGNTSSNSFEQIKWTT